MSLRFFSICVLIFSISCSTTPVKYDKPVKVEDYKHFVRLKDKGDDTVSKKTLSQKVKEAFTKKSPVKVDNVQSSKTNKVQFKKSKPLYPKRRIRKINTNRITNEVPVLQENTRPPTASGKKDIGKTIMLYLVYLQAFIILLFAIAILRRQKKVKSVPTKTGELNL